jgi:hypothetical protein
MRRPALGRLNLPRKLLKSRTSLQARRLTLQKAANKLMRVRFGRDNEHAFPQ